MTSSVEKKYGIINYHQAFYYAGEVKNGLAEGYGVDYIAPDKVFFKGQHTKDKIVGLGVFILKEGQFAGLVKDDSHFLGRITYKSGHIFDGEVFNNKPHGKGVIKSPDGEEYAGSFLQGLKSDYGVLRSKESILKCFWTEGRPSLNFYFEHFWIKPIHPLTQPISLDTYSGETKEGLPHGKGKCILPNCNFYDGEWKDGFPHGKGKIYFRQADTTYEGDFNEGKIDGTGTITQGPNCYKGEVKGGLPHGQGILTQYANRYVGTFNKGLPVQGKFFCQSPTEYEGLWKEGRPAIRYFQ